MTNCKHCGAESGCGKPDCDGSELPSCTYPPEHCDQCPPWICESCHELSSATEPCSCWTSLDGLPLADIKAIFAADGGFDLSPPHDR